MQSPNEYIRVLSATTILKLDPNRTEFLLGKRAATNSDDLVVQSFAREFFGEGEDPNY